LRQWLDETLQPWFEGRIVVGSKLAVNQPIAERWGVLAGHCQLKGRPLKVSDGFIAATALEHDLTVVTRNVKDFADLVSRSSIPGTRCECRAVGSSLRCHREQAPGARCRGGG
jgi:hypothetical protein